MTAFSLTRTFLDVVHAASGSVDERLLLAIQTPEVTDVGLNSVCVADCTCCPRARHSVTSLLCLPLPLPSQQLEVGFRTGPNGFSFDYTVACYAEGVVDCGGVLGADTMPIDSVSGPLPRDYSNVVAQMTVRD